MPIARFHRPAVLLIMLGASIACGGSNNTTSPPASVASGAIVPRARWLAAMVYDDTQNRVLMFGGFSSSGTSLAPLNDLWSWDGATWTSLSVGGIPGRGDMLAAWDGTRRRLVVYGGANDDGPLGDTWEWDGTTWSQRATVGPSIRRHFAGGFDKARGRVVLAGGLLGVSETALTDTWEWDGQQWTQRATTMPSTFTAMASSMAYSETRGALLMLAGSFSSGPSALWQWSGSAWTSVAAGPTTSLPVPLATTGSDEITVVLSTGATLRWQGTTFSQVSASGPTAAFGSMVYDKARAKVVWFGGLSGSQTSSDTWLWNGSAWSQVAR